MIIHSLTCSRDFALASACFRSQVEHLHGLSRLIIHDDGTITEEQRCAFEAISEKVEVRLRGEREERVLDQLSHHPLVQAWRDRHPLMLKVVDIVLECGEDALHYLDSDIFFFTGTNDLLPNHHPAVCCHDDGQGFSGPLLSLKRSYGARLIKNFNSGILKFPKSRFDLDFMEDFLGRPDLLVQPGMVEQTLFCLLTGSGPTWQTTQKDVHCSYKQTVLEPSALAVHFIYSMKADWAKYIQHQPMERTGQVALVTAQPLTYSDIVARKVRRVARLPV